MRPEKLLSMANQIASFFRSYPEPEATAGVEQHITAFWTPVMAQTLRAHLAQDQAGADQLVVGAMIRPPDAESPSKHVTSPARMAGPMASDAG